MSRRKSRSPVPFQAVWWILPLFFLMGTLSSCNDGDLSLPKWGPYSLDQIGPVHILKQEQGHAVGFPIVVGQADGTDETRNLRFHKLWWDSRPGRETTWKVLGWEANRNLTYWSYRILFRETQSRDWTVPNLPGWENGEAKVECIRTFEDMIIVVTFKNDDSAEVMTFFVDLLGGYDTYFQALPPEETVIHKDVSQGWMTIEHPGADVVFAVRGSGATAHLFDIRDDYFYPGTVSNTQGIGMHDDGTYEGSGNNWWMDYNLAQIDVEPGGQRSVYFVIKKALDRDLAVSGAASLMDRVEPIVESGRRAYDRTRYVVADPLYRPSMEHAVSQILINTVYNGKEETAFLSPPLQRYFTPSRFYSSFHHWDAGCISIGLMEYDTKLATENMDAALPDEWPWGWYDIQPVPPTAIFALWELYQRTQDVALLKRYYPAARNWYLNCLMAARSGDGDWILDWHGEGPNGEPAYYGMGSGMDDLPVWEHARTAGPDGTLRHVEPPGLQSLFVRAAKILRMMARAIGGLENDMGEYSFHVDRIRAGLQAHMWHGDKGIFAPIWQDDKSFVEGYEDTIIGIYPIFAGLDVITGSQKDRILEYMTDPDTLWSGFGVRSVSRSAPYYTAHFGWGGAVWICYEWFIWKGLLAFGEVDLARELAWQVLENFRANHQDRSYLSEMWDGDSGLTIGAKDFTGLGSPILTLYASYTTPGRISTGWDVSLHGTTYDPEADRLEVTVSAPDTPGPSGFVAVMGEPESLYRISTSSTVQEILSEETGAVSFVEDVGFERMEMRVEKIASP